MSVEPRNRVTEVAAESPEAALVRLRARLARETDCWDVHSTQKHADRGFVLVDVRSEEAYERGHLPGAISIPHWKITARGLEAFPKDTLFVLYCAGPHCNGSTRGAIKVAELGRPVKEMIGGIAGWLDEGFSLEGS